MAISSSGSYSLKNTIQFHQTNLFSREEGDDIGTLMHKSPRELLDFRDHTFLIRDDADMRKLQKSIEANGVLDPILAFQNEEQQLEIIAGHRRRYASQKLGLQTIPVLVLKNISRDDALFLMCESNLSKREVLLPSERANSYKMMIIAMNRKSGQRTDLKNEDKGRSVDLLSANIGVSGKTIQRYIRLTYLKPEILKLVDQSVLKKNTGIAMLPAIEISYLPENYQEIILKYYQDNKVSPSHDQARRMRQLNEARQLDEMRIYDIMNELKPNQKRAAGIVITNRILLDLKKEYGLQDGPFQDMIVKAIHYYQQHGQSSVLSGTHAGTARTF